MYQEQNFGRVKDQQAHDKEVVKLKKEIDFLSNSYSQLVEDARIEISMEKLKLAKEQRCILQSQAYIIQNMRKAMKEVQMDRGLLKEEKKKLEYLIADLLKAGHCTKEKMEMIKAIVDE
ncbi:putative chloride channel-like protein CLC-g [Hordeum vulgare]|nr:putative chloride channel-like protein CLC-g [Hordeum vulgare]